ncbi:DUF2085 domain-containing protein [Candidatus Micrarchaeota archaeon]|nr:MAG: DUF2085 domain-containing protein [Candidatus Micrarchaeota archaeon]
MSLLCHGRPERCFAIGGKRMPICSRCTGIYIGVIFGLIFLSGAVWNLYLQDRVLAFLLLLSTLVPIAIDGMLQFFALIKSNNARRFFTGLLAGIGTSGALFVVYRSFF